MGLGGGDAIADATLGGIMPRLKIALPTAVLLGGFLTVFLSSSTPSFGKAEYVKQTKKPCAFCHKDAQKTPKELTDAGKYFAEHKSLDGYKAPAN
jgi:hypothetical protein